MFPVERLSPACARQVGQGCLILVLRLRESIEIRIGTRKGRLGGRVYQVTFVVVVRTVLKNCADVWASNREEGAFVESAWVLIIDAREWLGRSGDRGRMGDAALSRTVLCGSGVSKDLRPT